MRARILFRDSQGRDGQIELNPGKPAYVGRAVDCAIRTDDAMVSRKHSMIQMEAGRFFVEDLGSSNGTHVNNERVTRRLLDHNDVVRCGSLWLRYVEDGSAAPQPAPTPGQYQLGHAGSSPVQTKPGGSGPIEQPQFGGVTAQPQTAMAEPLAARPRIVPPSGDTPSNLGIVSGQSDRDMRANIESTDAGSPPEASIVVDMEADVVELKERLEELRTRYKEVQRELAEQAVMGRERQSRSVQLEQRSDELLMRVEDLKRQLAAARGEATGRLAEIERLKRELATERDGRQKAEAESRRLSQELAGGHSRDVEALRGELAGLKLDLQKAEAARVHLRAHSDKLEVESRELSARVVAMEGKLGPGAA